jgi:hypothetical protein
MILSAKGENKYLFHIALWNFFLLDRFNAKRELSIPYFFARVDINRFFMFYTMMKGTLREIFFVFVARMMISAGAFFINCVPFNNDDDDSTMRNRKELFSL